VCALDDGGVCDGENNDTHMPEPGPISRTTPPTPGEGAEEGGTAWPCRTHCSLSVFFFLKGKVGMKGEGEPYSGE